MVFKLLMQQGMPERASAFRKTVSDKIVIIRLVFMASENIV